MLLRYKQRKSMNFGESTFGKSSDLQIRESSNFRYHPWGVYKGVHINRGRVGEDRGGKETDRCPLSFIY
jgi:hypothetical protein